MQKVVDEGGEREEKELSQKRDEKMKKKERVILGCAIE